MSEINFWAAIDIRRMLKNKANSVLKFRLYTCSLIIAYIIKTFIVYSLFFPHENLKNANERKTKMQINKITRFEN